MGFIPGNKSVISEANLAEVHAAHFMVVFICLIIHSALGWCLFPLGAKIVSGNKMTGS